MDIVPTTDCPTIVMIASPKKLEVEEAKQLLDASTLFVNDEHCLRLANT